MFVLFYSHLQVKLSVPTLIKTIIYYLQNFVFLWNETFCTKKLHKNDIQKNTTQKKQCNDALN